jgi:hypothetical protein
MNNTAIMFTAAMLLALLVTAVVALPESAGAQSADAKRPQSPFACNRLALTPEQRKRHFDELFDIDMRLEREGGSLWLGLTGREGVKQFIQADGAAWIRR